MAYDIPYIEPNSFTAGDSVSWYKSLPDYSPADGWSLAYRFKANGHDDIPVAATTSGTDFLVSISATVSATFSASDWYWYARVTKGSEVHVVQQGRTEVSANPDTSTADPRSLTKRTLDAIQAAILGAASKDELSMSVDGLALSYRSLDELSRLEVRYQARYNRELGAERQARGLRDGSVINTRFTRPS